MALCAAQASSIATSSSTRGTPPVASAAVHRPAGAYYVLDCTINTPAPLSLLPPLTRLPARQTGPRPPIPRCRPTRLLAGLRNLFPLDFGRGRRDASTCPERPPPPVTSGLSPGATYCAKEVCTRPSLVSGRRKSHVKIDVFRRDTEQLTVGSEKISPRFIPCEEVRRAKRM